MSDKRQTCLEDWHISRTLPPTVLNPLISHCVDNILFLKCDVVGPRKAELIGLTWPCGTYRELGGLGPDSIKRCRLTRIGNLIVEIRWSKDRLISTMGFPILVRWHLYIESRPWSLGPGAEAWKFNRTPFWNVTLGPVLEIPTGPLVRGRQLWRRTGTFLWFFFNFVFMIWDSRHEDLHLFWLSFKHWWGPNGAPTLTLYMLHFSEGIWAYIYILCHCSTLTCPVDETASHDQVAHKIGCLYISLLF